MLRVAWSAPELGDTPVGWQSPSPYLQGETPELSWKHDIVKNTEKEIHIAITSMWCDSKVRFCHTQNVVCNLIVSLWSILKSKKDHTCIRHIQQKTFTMVYISFLFIPWNCPYCRILMDEIWNWADSFFSTKLWYKLAQFSILLLINLTGAQFVK